MSTSTLTHRVGPLTRLFRLSLLALPVALLLLAAYFWLSGRIPRAFFWKSALVFLVGIEFVYVLTATVTVVGAVVAGTLLIARRTDRARRRKPGRCLLLCFSLAISFLLAEVASALTLARIHERSAVPAGAQRPRSRAPGYQSAACFSFHERRAERVSRFCR